jgi:hypothetical protein
VVDVPAVRPECVLELSAPAPFFDLDVPVGEPVQVLVGQLQSLLEPNRLGDVDMVQVPVGG